MRVSGRSDDDEYQKSRQNKISEAGQALPLIVLAFLVLLGFMGIAIDVGFALAKKRQLQAATDIALISGARELPDAAAAANTAEEYLDTNWGFGNTEEIIVNTSTSCMIAGCGDHDRLEVSAAIQSPTFFSKLFGFDQFDIGADGAACGPCESSPVSYDVVVVLDRSYSMCTSGSGAYNGCSDIENARQGIRELLTFFSPETDRVSLAVLSSADTNSCVGVTACPSSTTYGRPYSHTDANNNWITASSSPAPCDSANPSHPNSGSNGRFYRSAGDFMDGSPSNHDQWVLVDLASGTDFKNPDGTLNESSDFLNTLDCIEHKYWTPVAPAIYEATQELANNGRDVDDDGNEVYQAIVFFGDGGANTQPMRRQNNGTPYSTTQSWYSPTAGNNNRPCHDAVGQAEAAWNNHGIHVYSIGYALGEGSAMNCGTNSGSTESGINAESMMEQLAQGDGQFYEQATAGQVDDIFAEIGHAITAGGTRLVD